MKEDEKTIVNSDAQSEDWDDDEKTIIVPPEDREKRLRTTVVKLRYLLNAEDKLSAMMQVIDDPGVRAHVHDKILRGEVTWMPKMQEPAYAVSKIDKGGLTADVSKITSRRCHSGGGVAHSC